MKAYLVSLVLSVPNSSPVMYKALAGIRLAKDNEQAKRIFYLDVVEKFPEFTQIEVIIHSEVTRSYLVQLISQIED